MIDVRVVAAWTSWVAIVIGVMLLVAACDDLSVKGRDMPPGPQPHQPSGGCGNPCIIPGPPSPVGPIVVGKPQRHQGQWIRTPLPAQGQRPNRIVDDSGMTP